MMQRYVFSSLHALAQFFLPVADTRHPPQVWIITQTGEIFDEYDKYLDMFVDSVVPLFDPQLTFVQAGVLSTGKSHQQSHCVAQLASLPRSEVPRRMLIRSGP